MSIEKSTINFRRCDDHSVKIDFTESTNGMGQIHLFYAGKFVKTVDVNLTDDMRV